jgi:hypothetical protein
MYEPYYNPLIHFLLAQHVEISTITLLLLFPVIVTVVVVLRQIVGIQAFGIYTPSIITLSFVFIGQQRWSDIKYAIMVYVTVIFVGMMMRYVLKQFRLLYLPRVAITLTVVSFAVLAILAFGGSTGRTGFSSAPVFPILIIIMLVEKFVTVQIEKGSRTALLLAVETLFIALVGYTILSPTTIIGQTIIRFTLIHTWIVLLIIPINLFIGKWTGLRLSEYLRFRDVIKKIQ